MGKMENGKMQLYVVKGNMQQFNIQANHMVFLVCSHGYIISLHIKTAEILCIHFEVYGTKIKFEENCKQIKNDCLII